MVDLSLALEDDELRRRFGSATLERARDYVLRGMVLDVRHDLDLDGDLAVEGTVAGSTDAPYAVAVSVGHEGDGLWVRGRCSCPVRDGCKHTLALLLTVRAEQERASRAAGFDGARRWERRLSSLLDELDAADDPAGTATVPLALQVELHQSVTPGHRAWQSGGQRPARGTVRIRPLQRGARHNWVRTGVGWLEIASLAGHRSRAWDPDQVTALGELLAGYRAATRAGYFGSESHLPLGSFGPSLWRLLERLDQVGVPLVPGAGLVDVSVSPEPVPLRLDVNGGDTALHLALGVEVAGEDYRPGEIDVLGDAGHGVALWSPAASGDGWALTLAPLTRPVGPEIRRLLADPEGFEVPVADRDDLVGDYLPRLSRHVPVVSSDGSVVLPEPATPRLVLTVTWVAVDEVRIAWTWRYAVSGTDRVYKLGESRGLRGLRRPELEHQLLDGLELDDEATYHLCDRHRRVHGLVPEKTFEHALAVAFATDVLPVLAGQVEVEEIGDRPDYREATSAPVVHFSSREPAPDDADEGRTDWLDLEVVISVDGQFIALAHLLEALTRGHPRVVLRSGLHIAVDLPEFAHLARLVQAAGEIHDQPDESVRVSHHDLGLWDELAEVGIVDAQAQEWVQRARALRDADALPEVATPAGLTAELRSYQRDGFRWLATLWQAGLGGILADDMGLGKTVQTLALVAHARAHGAGPFLVVAPTSVVSMWAHEAATFTPGLVVRTVAESQARRGTSLRELAAGADIVVTSYTLYRLEVTDYVQESWGGLVLDEAQTVKNHQGKTYQAVRRLDVSFRLALTGTPLENRLMELWSLLSIVAPGLYPWPQRFTETVANPVERLGDTAVLDAFRRRIRPFLLRRTKDLVAADLPAKQEQVLEVELTPKHRTVYETHLQRERQTVLGLVEEDFAKHRITIFRSLTRLRQLSLDAALVDEKYDDLGSAKTDVLVDHLTELVAEGHRALVFSQFTSFLGRVRARLDREGITSAYLDGSTRRRGEVVDGFKQGDAPVFLISLKAGGVGLTLTEADYVFVLDPWWNPAVEAQAVDRTHRIGQHKPVNVYRLVATGTVEEKVMALKARKAALFSRVVDGDGAMATGLDADDVRALFAD